MKAITRAQREIETVIAQDQVRPALRLNTSSECNTDLTLVMKIASTENVKTDIGQVDPIK